MFSTSIFVKEFDTLEEAKEFVSKRRQQKKRTGIICRPNGPYKKEYKECQLLAGVTKPFVVMYHYRK